MPETPKLVLLNTETAGREFPLSKQVMTIGRTADCDICVEQPSVSRNHARVERFGNHIVVSDLGSRNGIRLNGQPMPEAQLEDGCTLGVGDVMFRAVNIPADAPAPAPPVPVPTVADEPTPPPLAPVSAQALAPVTEPQGRAVPKKPVITPKQAQKYGPFLIVIVTVILCGGAIAFVLLESRPGAGAKTLVMEPVKVKAGQNYWLRVAGLVNGVGPYAWADVMESTVVTNPSGIARVERFGPRELVVEGLAYGDTVATMETTQGNRATIKILVRGRLKTPITELWRFQGSDEERIQRANEHMVNGERLLRSEKPFEASKEFELAREYVKSVPQARNLYVRASTRMKSAQKTVNERYESLLQNFRLSWRQQNYTKALSIVKQILAMIPDKNDPRHQRTLNYSVTVETTTRARR